MLKIKRIQIRKLRLFFCSLLIFFVFNLNSEEVLLETANLLYLEGLNGQALELYSKWLPLKSSQENSSFSIILFRTAILVEDPQLSIQLLERYISKLLNREDQFRAYWLAGTQADLSGDILKACNCYKNAFEISKSEINRTNMLSDKLGAMSFLVQKHWRVAYYYAAATAGMGNRKEASRILKLIIKGSSDVSTTALSIMLYSRMLAELGQVQDAVKTAEIIFKLNLKRWPPVTRYWIEFLLKEYPKESMSLKTSYQAIANKDYLPLIEAVPTPSMILSGLFKKEKNEKVLRKKDFLQVASVKSDFHSKKEIEEEEKKVEHAQNKKTRNDSSSKKMVNLIQVGSFKDHSNAAAFSLAVNKKEFDTFVSYSKKSKYYRVFVKPQNKESIDNLLIRLKDNGFEGYLLFE